MQKRLITPCEAISWIGFKDFIKYRDPFEGPYCDEALRSDVYALCCWTPEEVLSPPSAGTDLGPERQKLIMNRAAAHGGLDGFRRHLDFLSSEYFRYKEARRRLLEALAGGQIEAIGVTAGSLEYVVIPVVIWRDNLPVKKALLDPLTNTLSVQVDGGEREYADLCLRQADVVRLWPEQGIRE